MVCGLIGDPAPVNLLPPKARFCRGIEATIVDISPDGGPNAALFPALDASEWNHEVLEEAVADGEVPGYRYERFTRKTPVTV